jgi:hypothetical protein
LARIAAALDWVRNTPTDSEQLTNPLNCVSSEQGIYLSQTQTHSPENFLESDPIETVDYKAHDQVLEEGIEQEFDEFDEFEVDTPKSANLKKSPASRKEEAEMRKTVQVLFELEESLLDQHITNIKVSLLFFSSSFSSFLISTNTNDQPNRIVLFSIGQCRNVETGGCPTSNNRASQ